MIPEHGTRRYPRRPRPPIAKPPGARPPLAMPAQQDFLGGVDLGSEIRRAPLIGMKLLHQRPVRAGDVFGARARRQAKDLIGLLLRHFAAPRRRTGPRCRVILRVFTPAGLPAVKISGQ